MDFDINKIYSCNQLLGNLDAENLNFIFMSKLDHACAGRGTESYYSVIIDQVFHLRGIVRLGDMPLVAAKLKTSVYNINANPGILYENFSVPEAFKSAIRLFHIEGVKYLCKQNEISLEDFYNKYFKSDNNKLVFAVSSGDYESFEKYFNLISDLDIDSKVALLGVAYKNGHLDIARFLLSEKVPFDAKQVLAIKPNLAKDVYLDHFQELKGLDLIDEARLKNMELIIEAMFSYDNVKYNTASKSIGNLIHSTDIPAIVSKIAINVPFNEVTRVLFGMAIAYNAPQILSPAVEVEEGRFNSFNYFKCYVPDPFSDDFSERMVPGLTWSIIKMLDTASFSSFTKIDWKSYSAYLKAREGVMTNIMHKLGLEPRQGVDGEIVIAESKLLAASYYCTDTDKYSHLLLPMAKAYSKDEAFKLLGKEQLEKINQLIQTINQDSPSIQEMLDIDLSLTEQEELSVKISSEFALSEEVASQKLEIYKTFIKEFKFALNGFCSEQNWSKEDSTFLLNMAGYIAKDEIHWKTGDLLPVFALVYADKSPNEKVLKLFEPMYKYWQQYIVPETDELMKKNFSPPLRVFMKEEKNLIDKILEFLGPPSEDRNWPSIYEKELELSELHPEYNMTEELLSFNITQCLDGTHTCD